MAATAHSNQAMAKLPEACQCMIDYFLSHQAASGSLEGLAVLPGVVELLTRLKVGCQDEHLKHQISFYGLYRHKLLVACSQPLTLLPALFGMVCCTCCSVP